MRRGYGAQMHNAKAKKLGPMSKDKAQVANSAWCSVDVQNIDIVTHFYNTFISVLQRRILGTQNFMLQQTP